MKKQQIVKFRQYEKLRSKAKQEHFFDDVEVAFRSTCRAHFVFETTGNREIVFIFDKDIVEVILGEMMYLGEDDASHVDDDDEQELAFGSEAKRAIVITNLCASAVKPNERAMTLFKRSEPAYNDDKVHSSFVVTIAKSKTQLFNLASYPYVMCGALFRMTTNIIGKSYQVLYAPSLRSCSCENVISFDRVVCAANF